MEVLLGTERFRPLQQLWIRGLSLCYLPSGPAHICLKPGENLLKVEEERQYPDVTGLAPIETERFRPLQKLWVFAIWPRTFFDPWVKELRMHDLGHTYIRPNKKSLEFQIEGQHPRGTYIAVVHNDGCHGWDQSIRTRARRSVSKFQVQYHCSFRKCPKLFEKISLKPGRSLFWNWEKFAAKKRRCLFCAWTSCFVVFVEKEHHRRAWDVMAVVEY